MHVGVNIVMESSSRDISSPRGRGRANKEQESIEKPRPKRLLLIILGSVILFLVVALGLGLGLGLGLKRNGSKLSPTKPSATPTSSPNLLNFGLGNESWRLNTSEYLLDMTTWDINASPTTRIYNFTISEIEAFPDGGCDYFGTQTKF